jgi:hypothetical protein
MTSAALPSRSTPGRNLEYGADQLFDTMIYHMVRAYEQPMVRSRIGSAQTPVVFLPDNLNYPYRSREGEAAQIWVYGSCGIAPERSVREGAR